MSFDTKKKYFKKFLNFLKAYPEFSVAQSSLDMKFFRLLRHFEIKPINPTYISRAVLAAVGNVPLPLSYHKRAGAGEAQAAVRKCAVISGQGFVSRALLPSFDKKHDLRIPVKNAGTSRDTKEWDPTGEITQERQFRVKTHIVNPMTWLFSWRGT